MTLDECLNELYEGEVSVGFTLLPLHIVAHATAPYRMFSHSGQIAQQLSGTEVGGCCVASVQLDLDGDVPAQIREAVATMLRVWVEELRTQSAARRAVLQRKRS